MLTTCNSAVPDENLETKRCSERDKAHYLKPTVIGKVNKINLTNNTTVTEYKVAVVEEDGTQSEPVTLNSLKNIDYFALFGKVDASLKKSDRDRLEAEMQADSLQSDLPVTNMLVAAPGFYMYKDKPILAMSDNIIKPQSFSTEVIPDSQMILKERKDIEMEKVVKKYFDFFPGVSELLFVLAMASVIQPILAYNNIPLGYVVAVEGASGSLKTTLTRCVTDWYESHVNEISFDKSLPNKKLEQLLLSFAGGTFLIDDYHYKETAYDRNRFKQRIDLITRIASGKNAAAGIFITAESLKDATIFSALDRMLVIKVPILEATQLTQLKDKIGSLDASEIVSIASEFARRIINDYDNASEMIDQFWNEYEMPEWIDNATRVGYHVKVVSLVFKLFKHYCMNESCTDEMDSNFNNVIEANSKEQIRELNRLRRKEKRLPEIMAVYKLVQEGRNCKTIKVFSSQSDYTNDNGPDGKKALYEKYKGLYYINRNALGTVMTSLYGEKVSITGISDALHDAGILVEDTDARTKKIAEKRHYVIDCSVLETTVQAMLKENPQYNEFL